MLDSDTTDTSKTDSPAEPHAAAPATPAAPPARKRAPRKRAAASTPADTPADAAADPPAGDAAPPRKRATRRPRAAATAAETVDAPAAEAEAPGSPQAAEPPAAARPRKRPTKKAAPAADPEQTPQTPAAADIDAAPAPPAKKATRKRGPKKAAEPAAPAAESELTAEPEAGLATAAPTVLFQAPDAGQPAPARRRRTARKASAEAEPAAKAGAEPVPADADIAVAEDAEDLTAEPEDVREVASEQASGARRRRRRRRGRGGGSSRSSDQDTAAADDEAADADAADTDSEADTEGDTDGAESSSGTRRRRRRRRSSAGDGADSGADADDPKNTVVHVREKRGADDGVKAVKGSTRLEAKRQRRRDGRETTRRRAPILTEAEFLARRESVDRVMAVRQNGERTQIAVLEDGVLVEHYVTRASATSYVGNVYLGRVQNVLPSMEAAFVDIGKGRNGVLYAGEVNWDAAGLEGKARAIEQALKSGDTVLVQVTKDPIGHKGARLTSQISLPGRYLVYVPGGGMTGISRRLPDTERHRLKAILRKIVPDEAGVIVRTAAEGASEEDLRHDVDRLRAQWEAIEHKAKQTKNAPMLVHGEPDLAIRVVRDVFNEDFNKLLVQGDAAWDTISEYVRDVAPELGERVSKHVGTGDLFADLRVDEQLMKALDRKVWLPSGGSLIIDRTEAMTVIDVNTGKFVGAGGNLEQTVTRNNLEAAEEIARQLRLRDVGGIVVIDFIDMVLESNRELVLRRLVECLGRDRTKHQVAEVTSLGLVQMTRKRVGEGLLEAFSEPCEVCSGRGVIVHAEPVDQPAPNGSEESKPKSRRKRGGRANAEPAVPAASPEQREAASAAIAAIHRAAAGETPDTADGQTPGRVDELASGLVAAALEAERPPAEQREPTADAVQAVAAVEGVAAVEVGEQSETPERTPSRRRRRTASRPAGPPVPAAG